MSVEDTLETIKKQLEDHEKRIAKLEVQPQTKEEPSTKKLSIKEFILSKKPKNEVQKTLVIGYYLEKRQGFSSFNSKDLEEGFMSAREPVPKNINLAVIGNVSKGHMMEDKERKEKMKAWCLTNTGEEYVNNNLKKMN